MRANAILINQAYLAPAYKPTSALLLVDKDKIRFPGENLGTNQIGSASISWRSYHPWPTTLPGSAFD